MSSGVSSSLGGVEQWIDIEVIQTLTGHASAVVVAVVLFWLVGLLTRRMMHDSIFKRALLLIDEIILFALFLFLAYEIVIFIVGRVMAAGVH